MTVSKLSEGSTKLREKVLETLEKSPHPLSILAVQKAAGIGHWLSAKNILLELMLADKVTCRRIGKALLFATKKEAEC